MSFSSLHDFYTSKEWRSFRKQFISEHLLKYGDIICGHCNKPVLNSYDIILHHIEHLTETNVQNIKVSLNSDNIMLLHHKCHNLIHQKFSCPVKRIYLVFGAPCSGKLNYIETISEPDDLIIDIDRIYKAINNTRSNKVFDIVMNIYNNLLDTAATTKGRWKNCYITSSTLPNVERIRRMTGAELVYIDTPLNKCLKRGQEKIKLYGQPYEDAIFKFFEDWECTYKTLLSDKL